MKFCGKCGSQMGDEDRVCGNCGTPVANGGPIQVNPTPTPVQNPSFEYQSAPNQGPAPQKKSTSNIGGDILAILNKFKFVIIGVVVAIILVIVGVAVIKANSGYKATLKKVFAALEDCGDKNGLQDAVDLSLDVQSSGCIGNATTSDRKRDNERRLKDAYETMERKVDKVKKITFDIVDADEYTESELDDLKAYMESAYQTYTEEMTEAVTLTVKIFVEGDGKKTFREEIVMIKESGDWKIFSYREM